jgi:hypothetical protein
MSDRSTALLTLQCCCHQFGGNTKNEGESIYEKVFYVFYFVTCEDFHKYQMSTTNMPPTPRGFFFVFVVSRWLHIF